MIIGKKRHIRHRWCAGIEFSLRTPSRLDLTPRFEIWCYKIVKYPPQGQMFDKKTDIKGFWRIFWLEKNPTKHIEIHRRKGFRDHKVTKIKGGWRLRSW